MAASDRPRTSIEGSDLIMSRREDSRRRGFTRLMAGLIWIPLQIVIIPLILAILALVAIVQLGYQIVTGNTTTTPGPIIGLFVWAENVEGWNRQNLLYIFNGRRKWRWLPE